MHAYAGYWLGDDTAKLQGRLSLNPLNHIDPFLTILLPVLLAISGAPIFGGAKPVPFNPNRVNYGEWGAALVAAAGPLTNFVIAFLAFGVWALLGHPTANLIGQFMGVLIVVNLGFFIFNSIPIPPLDGSRVLYALAPEFVRRGMDVIEQFGIIFIFFIIVVANRFLAEFMTSALGFFLDLFSHIFGLT